MLAEIWSRCDAVEECYEFMLAYAAQGLPCDQGTESGGQVREFLHRAAKALAGSLRLARWQSKKRALSQPTNTWRSLRYSIATLAILLPPSSWFWPNPPLAPS